MPSVLAVDDSNSLRGLLAQVLRAGGYQVVEAVDGQDALDKLHTRTVDVVVTDQHMPRMDGLALTRAVRALPQVAHVPVLILTTESDPGLKDAGRAAGATGWLVKPFEPERLLQVIGQVCGQDDEARACP